jgi:hypothetical protein
VFVGIRQLLDFLAKNKIVTDTDLATVAKVRRATISDIRRGQVGASSAMQQRLLEAIQRLQQTPLPLHPPGPRPLPLRLHEQAIATRIRNGESRALAAGLVLDTFHTAFANRNTVKAVLRRLQRVGMPLPPDREWTPLAAPPRRGLAQRISRAQARTLARAVPYRSSIAVALLFDAIATAARVVRSRPRRSAGTVDAALDCALRGSPRR